MERQRMTFSSTSASSLYTIHQFGLGQFTLYQFTLLIIEKAP